MKKRVIGLILVLALLLSLNACAEKNSPAEAAGVATSSTSKDEGTVEITYWHTYDDVVEAAFNEYIIAPFEAMYPNIKVNSIRMPYEGLDEQLVTSVTGDAAPDVVRIDATWVPQMAKLGALECLNGYEGFQEIFDKIIDAPKATTVYNGQNYGFPLESNTVVAIYNNQTLKEYGFDAPPKTMDELMTALDKTDPANGKYLFAIQGTYTWAMLPFIWTLGGNITDENYTVATGYLNSAETVNALDTIATWYKDGVIGPSIVGSQPDAWGGIGGGNYIMIDEGTWFFSSGFSTDEYTAALLPSVDGRSISINGGQDIVMTSTSKNKEAAWKFIQFIYGYEQQAGMATVGMFPVTTEAIGQVDSSCAAYADVYMAQIQTARNRVPSPNWPSIATILDTAFEEVVTGVSTAQDALDAAAPQIDALLAQ